jgi:two-component system, NarL family, sensor kinase
MTDNNVLSYIIVSSIIILFLALVMVFFFSASQRKIANTKLQLQEKELKFQKELLQNTIDIQEAERDRIAKDLHDDVASKLNIIHLNLHLLRQKITASDEITMLLHNIDTSIQESAAHTRTMSHELMPPLLKKFGLSLVLFDLAESVNSTEQLYFDIIDIEILAIKTHLKALHIYRIVQELINNTLKYASAKNAMLQFSLANDGQIRMIYKDDGVGFDLDTMKRGHGLSNIETRIRLLHGKLTIDTKAQQGATFTFIFPNND